VENTPDRNNKEFEVYGARQNKKHTPKAICKGLYQEEEEVQEVELKAYVWGGRRSGWLVSRGRGR
jgi:hypothetical protein